jgi:hypothetical protein
VFVDVNSNVAGMRREMLERGVYGYKVEGIMHP